MADPELEAILNSADDADGDGADKKVETSVDKRIKSVIAKEKNLTAEAEKKAQEALDRASAAEFRADFAEVSRTYPQAEKHKEAIQEKVKKGYTVADATLSVLNEKGELRTSGQGDGGGNKAAVDAHAGAGGSADVAIKPDTGDRKPVKDMTQAERVTALKELEAEGKIGLTPSGQIRIRG